MYIIEPIKSCYQLKESLMKILLTGATGFVGTQLCKKLVMEGHDLVIFTRNKKRTEENFPFPAEIFEWEDHSQEPPGECFEGVNGIIHLMGESIAEGRWTEEKKKRLWFSRVDATRSLVAGVKNNRDKHNISFAVSTSAIGYYPFSEKETYKEDSQKGDSFLADLCEAWEGEFNNIGVEIRKSIIRVGLVLGRGGALEKLNPVFSYGMTSPLGSGKQWMSWIHIDDLVNLYYEAATNPKASGIFNAVSDTPETNKDFHKKLAKCFCRPMLPATPAFVLKIVLGEMSMVLLGSQKILSDRHKEIGFQCKFNELSDALKDIFPYGAFTKVKQSFQFFPNHGHELFDFFKEANNLENITPPLLKFKVLNSSTEDVEEGTIINYKLKVHGVPFRWRTEIKSWKPPFQFRDFQQKGPYNIWDHTHSFYKTDEGLLMEDYVIFKLPVAALTTPVVSPLVNKDVNEIFSYRRKVLDEKFLSKD